MIGVLRPRLCTGKARLGRETTWVNEMNVWMNHAPDAGSIAQPVGLQSSVLQLSYGCSHFYDK